MFASRRRFLTAGSCLLLGGCAGLPASGPQSREIQNSAAAVASAPDAGLQFALVDLTRRVLDALTDPGPGSLFRSFGTGHGGVPELLVGVGDTVQVTIFESASGGLFIPNDAGARAGNFVQIPNQTVDQRGYISVPYAGSILARGRSPREIQREIETKLVSRAIEPQAIVSLIGQTSSQVTVIGQVGAPNKVNINPDGDRVLDIISRTSGISAAGFETFVTLQRRGRTGTIYFLNLVSDPRENIFVAPGDVIYVFQQKRTYTTFGASGQSGQFNFDQEHLTLADAVGKSGGLLDERADPGQVLVYRAAKRKLLERIGVDLSAFPPEQSTIPTIFRANFREAASFFVATGFYMHDRDVLYVTNADKVELLKFLGLATGVSGAAANIAADALTVRQAVRVLQ